MRDRVLLALLVTAGALFGSAALAAEPAKPERSGRTVEVVMHHSRFLAEDLSFDAGQRVTFVLRNEDPIDHEFILGDEAVQVRHETGTEPYHDALPTEVTVPALTTLTTTVVMPAHGPWIMGCHIPGHYAYGMRADITIR